MRSVTEPMQIGVVVYSHWGHTWSVAVKLREKLSAAGHVVALERIEPAGSIAVNARRAELKTKPAIDNYDAVVFGSPVWGGVPAAPMVSYLEGVTSLQGKQVACLVTGFFPAAWGRNQTIAHMQAVCEAKGATVCGSESVGWWSLNRRRQIARAVSSLANLLARRSAGIWADENRWCVCR
jgi:flavodoxin